MHIVLMQKIVDVCRQRSDEGDCSTVSSFGTEMLENCIIQLDDNLIGINAIHQKVMAELEAVKAERDALQAKLDELDESQEKHKFNECQKAGRLARELQEARLELIRKATMTPEEVLETRMKVCATEREAWNCPNMKEVEGDLSMDYEHYKCAVCGRTMKLDYEEMK